MAHKAQGNIDLLLPVYSKEMIKDTDEQVDEEVHRVRSGRVPSTAAASVPVESGYGWTCSPTQTLSNLVQDFV